MRNQHGTAYGRIERILAAGGVVLLDGGVASEVAGTAVRRSTVRRQEPETWAIYDQTSRVTEVHQRYAAAGCDVISTDTWGLLAATGSERGRRPGRTGLPAWTVAARDAVALARKGIAPPAAPPVRRGLLSERRRPAPGRRGDAARAALDRRPARPRAGRDAAHAAARRPCNAPSPTWPAAACRSGSASRSPTGPPRDPGRRAARPRAAGRAGVPGQLHPTGRRPRPRSTPSAVPRPGRSAATRTAPPGCRPGDYAERSMGWKAQGASIIGGCCGVGPAHVAAVREAIPDLQERTS